MRRLAAMSAGLALALVLISGSATMATHAWGPYHWNQADTPELPIVNHLDDRYRDHFDAAVEDWNRSAAPALAETSGAELKNCGAVDGQVEVCSDTYGFKRGGWLGVATIWADGDHIVKATVQLNDTFLLAPGSTYDTDDWRQLVTCQEIGHIFGLDHQDENFNNENLNTCMDYTDRPSSNLQPNQHDYLLLAEIYGHDDSDSGGGGDGGGNCPPRNPNCGTGALKAPPFSQASRANGSVYVDHLRNGLTRVKHVFWVPRR